ncbi:pumilio/RRM domain-containing protein [Coprinopsis marcescibilis]|uniref:Pumilio/RRM domain-containing protein n=1 Tax=Coprinopsis marcescibilis TaxID=230819 RepID=A0A5C3L0G2_COPMA|nr:pumilio/RRM domain-containing protein [Coprinopsis marcescibilis]
MSLSANDHNGSYSRVPPSGKTPPPAPSAAFAKRARELQQAETQLAQRYRPPALRALASGGSPPNEAAQQPSVTSNAGDASTLPPTNYPPGYRRPRAGTLPSNVHLAAQRFAATSNTLGSSIPSTNTNANTTSNTSAVSTLAERQLPVPAPASNLGPSPIRPALRHAASIATAVPSNATSRLRSGSLTLPSGGLSNAFGGSIFSSNWLPSTTNGNGNGYSVLDELRSVNSVESGAEDFSVHTLDYLGLDDPHNRPPATLTELRNQAQAAIANNLTNPNRNRANTVSTYRTRPTVGGGSLLTNPAAEEDEEYLEAYDDYTRQTLGGYDMSQEYGASEYLPPRGYKHSEHLAPATRPRAISVGILDDPVRTYQRRGTTTDIPSYLSELQHPNSNVGNHSVVLKSDKITHSRSSPGVNYNGTTDLPIGKGASAYLLAPSAQQNRSLSPKSENQNNQAQTPTRSLWIGNLDSSVTSEQLIHIFAPYGAIESLRLLPEKECGFVNFVDQSDAIRAKEDVLNRLGGNIGMPNGQTVRIGFGKADSAPVAPAKGSNASPGPTSPNSASKTANIGGPNGMDAQLQSTPTRALWIGSIPSTTTPATILSVFSPYGPIESARVLTHKNCGFINFERLDDAVRARKALNGRDVLGSDVGAIRIGFAKVPTKNSPDATGTEDGGNIAVQGVGDLSVGATIHALRGIKGASTIPSDQQVLGGAVENYRSNLLLSMIGNGLHSNSYMSSPSVTEQQMIMRELSGGAPDAEPEIYALADFRPPTMYYTTIPLVSERQHNRRWDASKLRELRKRLDSGTMSTEEVDQVAADFLDGEIVDLASDWLGNTVVQKLFEKCSPEPRLAMLERICPSLAMIGIHKNGTWAAQKIIDCATRPEEIALITQNLRAYAPPLLLDQFGNYVVQCCLRFGAPSNDFIFDAIVDRMWEVAQGRFGARSMRACLESPQITINQQRRIATAVILNSIPLATNPNGALLLTWLLDTSGFPSRYNLLAPRFTPHLSHLCTHKLASLTVLRIVNQKIEPDASRQIVEALFSSPGDHVLTDVLGDQVNGVAVVHKILTSPFIDPSDKQQYMEATKRVLIELKVIATQAYRRLIEEVGLPVPNFQPAYSSNLPTSGKPGKTNHTYGVPGLPQGYPSNDQGLASMMAALQMGGQNPQAGPPQPPAHAEPQYNAQPQPPRRQAPPMNMMNNYSQGDQFNPFGMHSPQAGNSRPLPGSGVRRNIPPAVPVNNYGTQSPNMGQGSNLMGHGQPHPQPVYGGIPPQQQAVPPHMYHQQYMYPAYQQTPPSMGNYHA